MNPTITTQTYVTGENSNEIPSSRVGPVLAHTHPPTSYAQTHEEPPQIDTYVADPQTADRTSFDAHYSRKLKTSVDPQYAETPKPRSRNVSLLTAVSNI